MHYVIGLYCILKRIHVDIVSLTSTMDVGANWVTCEANIEALTLLTTLRIWRRWQSSENL